MLSPRTRRSRGNDIDRFTQTSSNSSGKHGCQGSKRGRLSYEYLLYISIYIFTIFVLRFVCRGDSCRSFSFSFTKGPQIITFVFFVFFLDARQEEEVDNDVDIGIVPAQGLVPPELCISDMESSKSLEAKPKYQYASTGHKCSSSQDMTSITQQVTSQVRPEEGNKCNK